MGRVLDCERDRDRVCAGEKGGSCRDSEAERPSRGHPKKPRQSVKVACDRCRAKKQAVCLSWSSSVQWKSCTCTDSPTSATVNGPRAHRASTRPQNVCMNAERSTVRRATRQSSVSSRTSPMQSISSAIYPLHSVSMLWMRSEGPPTRCMRSVRSQKHRGH